MRKFTLAVAAATLSVPAGLALSAAPAAAAPIFSSQQMAETQTNDFQRRYYGRNGEYRGPTWRGRDGRYRCRRNDGTTGLLIGGAAGALIGNQVAGRGDRLLGTVIGGAAGALIGREVDRGSSRNRGGRRCR